jgi:hypothetical protein
VFVWKFYHESDLFFLAALVVCADDHGGFTTVRFKRLLPAVILKEIFVVKSSD